MRIFRTLFLVFVILGLPAWASAVSVRDIIELTKAGLSAEVLVDLIDADRTIFTLDKEQILELKKAGVSDVVIRKMLRSRREFESRPSDTLPAAAPPASLPSAQPEVVVIREPAPEPAAVVVPQYYYIPVPIWGVSSPKGPRPAPQPFLAHQYRGFGRFINDGWVEPRRRP